MHLLKNAKNLPNYLEDGARVGWLFMRKSREKYGERTGTKAGIYSDLLSLLGTEIGRQKLLAMTSPVRLAKPEICWTETSRPLSSPCDVETRNMSLNCRPAQSVNILDMNCGLFRVDNISYT